MAQYTFPADVSPFVDTGIFIKADGTRALSGDWDIGAGLKIRTEAIWARSNNGLALCNDSGQGVFIGDNGFIGLGKASPVYPLDIEKTDLDISGTGIIADMNIHAVAVGSANSGDRAVVCQNIVFDNNAILNGGTSSLYGLNFRINNPADYLCNQSIAALFMNYSSHTMGTISSAMGCYASVAMNGAGGAVTDAYLGRFTGSCVAGTMTNVYGLHVSVSGAGTIGTAYGLYIDAMAGSTKWGIYVNTAGNNYFAGNVGIAITPTARLHISSPTGQDALKIETGQGGIITVDEWGILNFVHTGVGIGYDNNISQNAFHCLYDTYITSGKGSVNPYNIILMPSSTGKVGIGTVSPRKKLSIVGKINLGDAEDSGLDAYDLVDKGINAGIYLWRNSDTAGREPFILFRSGAGNLGDANSGGGQIRGLQGVNGFYFSDVTSAIEYLRIQAGNVGIGTGANPTALLDVNSNKFRLRTAKTPASTGDTGNKGDICWDSNYIYICVANNSWKRAAISAW